MFNYFSPIRVCYKTWQSGVTNIFGNERWFAIASEDNVRFVQKKETRSDKGYVKRVHIKNVYVSISQNETIQEIKYYNKESGAWRTIVGGGANAQERRIVERVRRLWQDERQKRRRNE